MGETLCFRDSPTWMMRSGRPHGEGLYAQLDVRCSWEHADCMLGRR